jgi:hypothetical protein
MTRIHYARLVSGPDAGRLQVIIDVRLSASDELAIGRASECEEAVEAELAKSVRGRSVGPAARFVHAAMWNALVDLAEKGRAMPKKKRKAEKKTRRSKR